ncbi:hypothetical protein BRC94_10665 [Halobacteriales archaeon QS_5_70_17]|nr:MAG: hypothetical protein BRC94_10665 [Halobacteriales archaeon QS_5_70_17]
MRRRPDNRLAGRAGVLAVGAAATVAVLLIGRELFPLLSVNHDEGVYLQHAAMLLKGNLRLTTDLPGAFRPWFFVEEGRRLYPKYTPVTAALFAPGVALGAPRVVPALVGGGIVVLIGLLAREAYRPPVGALAAATALATPFFLLIAPQFLSYAPATLLNLLFALGYVRAHRRLPAARASLAYAALAGGAIALAFFARPYTAVLFAAPFVGHAVAVLAADLRSDPDPPARTAPRSPAAAVTPRAVRLAVVAALGSTGVVAALAYNAVLTGDPLVFPYQAFAPLDGPGFGYRRLLDYERTYTPALALRATGHLLWELATRWTVAAPLGTLLAAVGLLTLRAGTGSGSDALAAADRDRLPDRTLRWLFAGVGASVVVGNIYFWGTLNVLGDLNDPADGFMGKFGPFYHFDLLLPLSVFGAAGLVLCWRALGARLAAEAAEATDHRQRALAPFDREFDRALVFLPRVYGPWLNHPFQTLRNGGSLGGGDVLYAQTRGPAGDFAVIDAYPDRRLYRYTFRGEWEGPSRVTPNLQRVRVREGRHHEVTTTVGAVGRLSTVRLATGEGGVTVRPDEGGDALTVAWSVNGTHATLGDRAVPVGSVDEVVLTVTYLQSGGASVTYRQEVAVDARGDDVRIIWPGEVRVCRLTTDCGREGTYVPGAGGYVDGIAVETNATARCV